MIKRYGSCPFSVCSIPPQAHLLWSVGLFCINRSVLFCEKSAVSRNNSRIRYMLPASTPLPYHHTSVIKNLTQSLDWRLCEICMEMEMLSYNLLSTYDIYTFTHGLSIVDLASRQVVYVFVVLFVLARHLVDAVCGLVKHFDVVNHYRSVVC